MKTFIGLITMVSNWIFFLCYTCSGKVPSIVSKPPKYSLWHQLPRRKRQSGMRKTKSCCIEQQTLSAAFCCVTVFDMRGTSWVTKQSILKHSACPRGKTDMWTNLMKFPQTVPEIFNVLKNPPANQQFTSSNQFIHVHRANRHGWRRSLVLRNGS